MGNTWIKQVKAVGYKSAATGTAIVQNIDPVPGYRAAVVACGATCSSTATRLYLLTSSVQAKVSGAVSASLVTIILSADPHSALTAKGLTATLGYVCVTLSDGTYQYTTVSTFASTVYITLTSALTVAIADGAPVWLLGLYSDSAHQSLLLTAGTQTTKDTSGAGVFYTDATGAPLIAYHLNNSSQIGSIDYISLNYINA
jgi:hypothetical protein